MKVEGETVYELQATAGVQAAVSEGPPVPAWQVTKLAPWSPDLEGEPRQTGRGNTTKSFGPIE